MYNYWTYIIKSVKFGNYYIGQSSNISKRLKNHNLKKSKSSKPFSPWIVIYQKGFATRSEAVKHERYLKSIKKRNFLEKIIKNNHFNSM